jgi:hypothetical protein
MFQNSPIAGPTDNGMFGMFQNSPIAGWTDDVMGQNCPIAGPMVTCFRSLMFQNSHVDDVMGQNCPIAGPMVTCFRSLMFQNSHVDDVMGQNPYIIATNIASKVGGNRISRSNRHPENIGEFFYVSSLALLPKSYTHGRHHRGMGDIFPPLLGVGGT